MHVPPLHVLPAVQRTPQTPQLLMSLSRWASQPLVRSRSQSPRSARVHIVRQVPVEQFGVALAPTTQGVPQVPQFVAVVSEVSHPSTIEVLQFP